MIFSERNREKKEAQTEFDERKVETGSLVAARLSGAAIASGISACQQLML